MDDGAIFYLNGAEIYRLRMADAPTPAANSDLAIGFPCGGDADCVDQFAVSGDLTTNLVSGDNVLAVEVHNYAADSPDITFGSALFFEQPFFPPPQLHVLWTAPVLTLYWNGTGWTLQQAVALDSNGAGWADVPGPVTRSPYVVALSNVGAKFYRLRR